MSKDLLKIALIGLTAGVCLSAQELSAKSTNILAMSKCSKSGDKASCTGKSSCDGEDTDDDDQCSGKSGCGSTSTEMKNKRKSIAQKAPEAQEDSE